MPPRKLPIKPVTKEPVSIYTDAFRYYIGALSKYCRDETYHHVYELTFRFMEHQAPDCNDLSSVKAEVRIDSSYIFMRLTIYPDIMEMWRRQDYQEIGGCILHEFCHAYLEPVCDLFMWDRKESQDRFFKGVIERQTETITRTLCRHFPQGWFLPERFAPGG